MSSSKFLEILNTFFDDNTSNGICYLMEKIFGEEFYERESEYITKYYDQIKINTKRVLDIESTEDEYADEDDDKENEETVISSVHNDTVHNKSIPTDTIPTDNVPTKSVPIKNVSISSKKEILAKRPLISEDTDDEESTDTHISIHSKIKNNSSHASHSTSFMDNPVIIGNGALGEEYVLELITKIKPTYETISVSKTGHVGDIHSINYDTTPPTKFIVEVKNKKVITYADLTKFERDLKEMTNDNFNIIGIFISLRTDSIPKIGDFAITHNVTYLTKNYVIDSCLRLIFDFMSLSKSDKTTHAVKVIHEVDPKIRELIMYMHSYNKRIQEEMISLKSLHDSILSSATAIKSSIMNYESMCRIIKEIMQLLNIEEANVSLADVEEKELIEYLKSNRGKRIKKDTLKTKFPLLSTTLASMKLSEIYEKYRN